jgi:hypothetical protein
MLRGHANGPSTDPSLTRRLVWGWGAEWGTMSSLPVNVAVFFGKVDKRPSGWYWTAISEGQIPHSGSIAGPFETKAAAIEDAHQAAITGHGGGID